MPDRVLAIVPRGVDLALDVVGNGVLPELTDVANGADSSTQENGVGFRSGDSGRADCALGLARSRLR